MAVKTSRQKSDGGLNGRQERRGDVTRACLVSERVRALAFGG